MRCIETTVLTKHTEQNARAAVRLSIVLRHSQYAIDFIHLLLAREFLHVQEHCRMSLHCPFVFRLL